MCEVNSLAGVMSGSGGGKKKGASGAGGSGVGGVGGEGGGLAEAKKKYEGYLGKEHTVLVNLLENMASE